MKLTLFAAWICISVIPSIACALDTLPPDRREPGGIAVVRLPTALPPETEWRYNGKRILTTSSQNQQVAIIGIPLTATGKQAITWNNGTQNGQLHFDINPVDYPTEHIKVPNQRHVNPAPQDVKRIEAESTRRQRAIENWSETAPASLRLAAPAQGRYSSPYGLRRFFNGEPRSPHSGLDIAAPEGAPVVAAQSGLVIESHDFFFNGKTVFIDHGQGLITLYCHLSAIHVKKGQRINVGERIGLVGQTGRASGPHLHFSTILNGVLVNPVYLLSPP